MIITETERLLLRHFGFNTLRLARLISIIDPRNVVSIRVAVKLVFVGIAIGVAGALAATRLLEKLLFGVSPNDPATYLAIVATMIGLGALACWLPARRASRIDPMEALRYE